MPPAPLDSEPSASGPGSGTGDAASRFSGGPGSSAGPKSVADSSFRDSRRKSSKRRSVKQVEKTLAIFDPILEDGSYAGVTLIDTKEGVIEAFQKINHYLKPRLKQLTREIFVSFGGHEISRTGFISLIAVTEGLTGLTYMFDVIALEDALWENGMRDFLEIPYNEKVVFDTREVKDCMLSVYGVTYKGMFDLRIIEIMQRGKVKCYNRLPHEKTVKDGITRTGVCRTFLFTLDEMCTYYVKESDHKSISYIKTTISEKNWRSRKDGVSSSCIRWMVEYQKFLIMIWRNFEFGDINRDKLWWISSELYNAMFFDKLARSNDIFEVNDYCPKFILCLAGTTDQPLGGVRCTKCMRMMPSSEYTPAMIRNRPTCACTLCVRIAVEGVRVPVAPPKKAKKKKKKGKKKKKKKKTKKVRIEGEEEEEESEEEESSEEEEEEAEK